MMGGRAADDQDDLDDFDFHLFSCLLSVCTLHEVEFSMIRYDMM